MNTNISHQNMVQALMKALYQNNLPTITDLLNQGVNVNLPYNDNGWTPFMWVCKEFYETDIIKQFLAYGGNVHSRNKAGETPFMIAAKKRSNPLILLKFLYPLRFVIVSINTFISNPYAL